MVKPCPDVPVQPRLPQPQPGRRPRRAAALLLALAVLAAHLAALGTRPPPVPPVPSVNAAPVQLRLMPWTAPPAAPSTAGAVTPARPAVRAIQRAPRPAPRPKPGPHAVADAAATPAPRPTAQPESSPPAAHQAAPPWPRYAATLPPAATRHFLLQRGGRSAPARLDWTHDAQGYELSLMAEGGELDGLGAASRGLVGAEGLVPQRHVERRRGRDVRATNFDLPGARVRGSGGGEAHPWPAGGQDRLSWLLQLAAVLQADARLAQPGARVVLAVAGPRGPSATWVFTVRGSEALTLADGRRVQGLALQRAAEHPYDLQVEAWLDPADHHLPLRLRLAAPPGEWQSEWLSAPTP